MNNVKRATPAQKQMTISEALAAGYTQYLFCKDGYQSLRDIEHVTDKDLAKEDIRLVSKQSYNPAGMDAKDIAETLAENIACQHSDESGDDTDTVYDAIKSLDFSAASDMINEALSKLPYYKGTDIKLIPDFEKIN